MNQLQIQANLGSVSLTWNPSGLLSGISLGERTDPPGESVPSIPLVVGELASRLREYFGEGKPLGPVPWDWVEQEQWTGFQKQVYRAISSIPHGETRTYQWVAEKLGKLGATRAVGQALRRNPLPILIPCHRVVASDSLGGFMGRSDPNEPELKLKRLLISLEEGFRSPMFAFAAPGASA